jgi:hypothetical protein
MKLPLQVARRKYRTPMVVRRSRGGDATLGPTSALVGSETAGKWEIQLLISKRRKTKLIPDGPSANHHRLPAAGVTTDTVLSMHEGTPSIELIS